MDKKAIILIVVIVVIIIICVAAYMMSNSSNIASQQSSTETHAGTGGFITGLASILINRNKTTSTQDNLAANDAAVKKALGTV